MKSDTEIKESGLTIRSKISLFLCMLLISYASLANIASQKIEKTPLKEANSLVSFTYDNASIREVIQSLAHLKQLNLLMSDDVRGSVTVNLTKVNWQQALTLVLELKGLAYQLHDNIIVVAPAEEMQKRRFDKLSQEEKIRQSEPLSSTTIDVSFAKASQIAETLKAGSNNIMTSRGQVTVDTRTNTLIIKDTQQALQSIKQVVKQLDVRTQQVLIEARMVTIRDNVNEQLGIRWGASSFNSNRSQIAAGSAEHSNSISINNTDVSLADKFNVNLPVINPAGRFALQVAKLSDGLLLDLELSALERESKGEIIATPRVLASNQSLSRIEQGTEIPYLQAAAHGATSVAFKKAVLSLEVTPQVTSSDEIILELNITQDARGESVLTSTGPTVAIDTQQITTKVSVKNGETIVLGGIFQQQLIKAVNKVPLLGDIPYLGRLFRSDSSYNEKRELLVFVTPKIIN